MTYEYNVKNLVQISKISLIRTYRIKLQSAINCVIKKSYHFLILERNDQQLKSRLNNF